MAAGLDVLLACGSAVAEIDGGDTPVLLSVLRTAEGGLAVVVETDDGTTVMRLPREAVNWDEVVEQGRTAA